MQSRRIQNQEDRCEDIGESQGASSGKPSAVGASHDRRAYYRVSGRLPIRVISLFEDQVEAEIFDLSMPDPLIQPLNEVDEDAPLAARLRRIEEKLDLLLGAAAVVAPKQLSGRDRQDVVFSGSGLCLDVAGSFQKGDPYKVEILLPPPYSRLVRAIARCVEDAPTLRTGGERVPMPLRLDHMEPEERDALVAYSYDLQRFALRARQAPAAGTGS